MTWLLLPAGAAAIALFLTRRQWLVKSTEAVLDRVEVGLARLRPKRRR